MTTYTSDEFLNLWKIPLDCPHCLGRARRFGLHTVAPSEGYAICFCGGLIEFPPLPPGAGEVIVDDTTGRRYLTRKKAS